MTTRYARKYHVKWHYMVSFATLSQNKSISNFFPHLSLYTERSLGARNLALTTRHPASSHPRSNSKRLECALGSVVVVVAAEAVNVHSDAGSAGEALDAVGDHLGAEIANLLALEAKVDNGKGTVRKIDDGAAEGLIERAVCGSEAGETGGSAEGLGEGVAESNADVFGGVVVVDCEELSQLRVPTSTTLRHGTKSTNYEGRPCKQEQDSSRRAWPGHGACDRGNRCRC